MNVPKSDASQTWNSWPVPPSFTTTSNPSSEMPWVKKLESPVWKPSIQETKGTLSLPSSYKHLYDVSDSISVYQDPIGNFVCVLRDDKISPQSPPQFDNVLVELKDNFFQVSVPYTRGIAIDVNSKMHIVIKSQDNVIEASYPSSRHHELSVYPILFQTDIIEDIETAIQSTEDVSIAISNIIQTNCMNEASNLERYSEDMKNISPVMEKIYHILETLTSFSRIYHEINASSYAANTSARPEIQENLSSINQMTYDILSIGNKMKNINKDIESALSQVRDISSEVTRIHKELNHMDSV